MIAAASYFLVILSGFVAIGRIAKWVTGRG